MKKIVLLLMLASCSKNEIQDDCNCKKVVYKEHTQIVQNSNGTINLISTYVIEDIYEIGCEEETEYIPLTEDLVYRIECE